MSVLKGAIERCASQRVHLELWPGPAVERMLRLEAVSVPLRAYPARPAKLFNGADRP